MRSVNEIQADINSTENAIQAGGVEQSQIDYWNMQVADFRKELIEAQEAEQLLKEDVQANGYIFDTLETSSGIKMIDLSYSPENHELQAIAVQRKFLMQQDVFNRTETMYKEIIAANADRLNNLEVDNDELLRENYELGESNTDLMKKLKNATDIIAEKDAEIKRLQEFNDTTQAELVIPLSKEEQEIKLMAEVMGKQIKVIRVKPKTDAFDNLIFLAVNAITGADIEDHYIYLSRKDENKPKRYKEIHDEEAALLKADYDAKKAEIDALNENVPTIELVTEPVVEKEVPTEETPFPTEEVQAAYIGEVQGDQGNESVCEVVEQGEVTLQSLKAEIDNLKSVHGARLDNIERIANIQAVA